ncbi:MAG: hypothetical protein PHD82_02150 [Candidatus Riflebacteria bacterium]|nr:hypothetical protein [Candidatus Riflebacteria bacterium]
MKKQIVALIVACMVVPTGQPAGAQSSGSEDYPLLSQGNFVPPPPPPGYSFTLPPMEPLVQPAPEPAPQPDVQPGGSQPAGQSPVPFASAPPPPVLPANPIPESASVGDTGSGLSEVPDSAKFSQEFKVSSAPEQRSMQLITAGLAGQLKRLLLSLKTMRSIVEKPESGDELRRIQLTGRSCADLLELKGFPVPSRFVASGNDRVLRDRSHEAVEYRHFGDFDNRVNGWIKPIKTALYVDLVFDGRSRRRTHVRAQFSRTGPLTGSFYAYSWDAFGNPWKMQGSMENLFVHDDGLPAGGSLKVYGADPAGKTMGLALDFPVKVHGEPGEEKTDTRHRTGQRVSIGN